MWNPLLTDCQSLAVLSPNTAQFTYSPFKCERKGQGKLSGTWWRLWAWGYSPCWGAEWQRGGGAAWGHQRVKEAENNSSLLPVVLGSSHCLSSKGVRAALSPHGVKEEAETWSTSQRSSCTASLPCHLLARQGTKLLPAPVWDEQVSIQENLFFICTWKS